MKRRQFLQTSLAGYLGSLGLPFAGITDLAFAQSPQNQSGQAGLGQKSGLILPASRVPLIVVFLRGGADGLSILSPLDDPDFVAARPPEMRFVPNHFNTQALQTGSTALYWHPAAEPLAKLFNAGRLVPWVAVGFGDETRSHFEAQEIIERGVTSMQVLPDNLGWMARDVAAHAQKSRAGLLPLFAGNNYQPSVMQGADGVLSARDLVNGINYPGGPASFRALQTLCRIESGHPASRIMLEIANTFDAVNQAFPKTVEGKVQPYASAGASPYPNVDPAVGLRSVARIVQANVGLQYAWVDHEGWDTHEYQVGRLNNLIRDFSNSLIAFDEDMQAQHQPYSLVVMTEFGRRLRTNRSNGSDHGHGSLAFVMGSSLAGNRVYGDWPGLTSDALDRGVDLAVTTHYAEVLKQAVAWGTQST